MESKSNRARVWSVGEGSAPADLSHLEQETPRNLISRFLRSREESMRAEAKVALEKETELLKRLEDLPTKEGELQRALAEERNRYSELEIKHRELETAKFVAAEEAERSTRTAERFRDQLQQTLEDLELSKRREQSAHQKIESLMEELERKGREMRELFVAQKVEVRDLECGRKRAEVEVDQWKIRYSEMEAKCLQLIDENSGIKKKLKSVGEERKSQVIEISDSDVDDCAGARRTVKHKERRTRNSKSEILESDEEAQFQQTNGSEVGDCNSVRRERVVLSSSAMSNASGVIMRCNMKDNEDTDEDDGTPIGKVLKIKKLSEAPTSDIIERPQSISKKRCLSDRVYASDEARSYAKTRAEEVQSRLLLKFPSFVKPMLKSHVTGGFWLGVPVNFSKKYLPSRDTPMTLIDEEGKESGTLYLTSKNGLSAGWSGFAISHKLVDGDALVFQLIQPTKFKVYIVRASGYASNSCGSLKFGHNGEGKKQGPRPGVGANLEECPGFEGA